MNEDDQLWIKIDNRWSIVTRGPSSGFEILESGEVYWTEDGVRRKANRLEAIQIRNTMRWAMGESIADAAGLEPE